MDLTVIKNVSWDNIKKRWKQTSKLNPLPEPSEGALAIRSKSLDPEGLWQRGYRQAPAHLFLSHKRSMQIRSGEFISGETLSLLRFIKKWNILNFSPLLLVTS